ncbi:NAD(P)-dependent oxidoreductase [Pontibacter sp. G13]|uniref:SDR family oxidoreductase n=1 Tax=Pontibacter sp. G13 TaxID=3074898 RepID=UPI00288B2874|nr:NAD(P)-dependent oxidoreductase [Pontibacter sp. G13]WNJ19458.1 NAD(P)-dependent oxidoreductase [Pontibacter sp. G13]
MQSLKGKTAFITGASRGIGEAIAVKLGSLGAQVVVAAKTDQPHPKLPGTIHTAVTNIESAGGAGLGVVMDVRSEEAVKSAIGQAVEVFGGIDILINNASAIQLTDTLSTSMKRFDLMHQVNFRGTFMVSQACIPHLKRAENPHILNISPPLNLDQKWFAPHLAYTMAKYGMSFCVHGMSTEFKKDGIAVNALWPATTIATAAVNMLGGEAMMRRSRKPEIMADAAAAILQRDSTLHTGHFYIDEEVLKAEGVDQLDAYAVDPSQELLIDYFL